MLLTQQKRKQKLASTSRARADGNDVGSIIGHTCYVSISPTELTMRLS